MNVSLLEKTIHEVMALKSPFGLVIENKPKKFYF